MPESHPPLSPGKRILTWLQHTGGITIILSLFVLWRLFFMTRNHDIIWDEAVYLGIGKFLWSAGASGLFEIIRPLGLSFILGGVWRAGLDPIFWGELLAIAFSAGTVYLTYLIGKELHSSYTGTAAALLLALTPTFFLYSGYILTDIPSMFFTLLSLLLFLSKRYRAAGFAASAAFMFRYPHGLFMASAMLTIGIYYLASRTNTEQSTALAHRARGFMTSFMTLPLVFMIANWYLYSTETSKAWHAIFRPWIFASWHAGNPAEAAGGWLYYLAGMTSENVLLLFSLLGLVWFFLNKEFYEQEQTLPWITLTLYLVYFSSIINKQMRFSIAFLPLASIMAAKGFTQTIDWLAYTRVRQRGLRAIGMAGLIGFGFLFLYPEDMKFYGWRFETPQPIVHEIYRYFEQDQISQPILTSDPLPAAYSNKRFEPFYFSVDSSGKIYDQHTNSSWGLLFVPEAFYCSNEDNACKDGLARLQEKIQRSHELVLEKQYGREDVGFRTYQIWKRKKG